MVLHYFNKKENADKMTAKQVYLSCIKNINIIVKNKEFHIKKDFKSTFELIVLFLFIIFYAYKKDKKNSLINQYIMNLFIEDLDKSFRDIGIGDMSIGKHVKSYVKKMYYRFSKLENIIIKDNFEEFLQYIKKINIQKNLNNNDLLSKFLFTIINNSLKSAKKNDLSQFEIII